VKICTIFIAQSVAVLSRTWPGLGLGLLMIWSMATVIYSTKGSYKYSPIIYSNCYNYFTLMKLLI
jgi:hypothetical protein